MSDLDDKTKQRILKEYLENPNSKLGWPNHRDSYTDIAKKLFPIQALPPGALPVYNPERCKKCGKLIEIDFEFYVNSETASVEHSDEECILYQIHNS